MLEHPHSLYSLLRPRCSHKLQPAHSETMEKACKSVRGKCDMSCVPVAPAALGIRVLVAPTAQYADLHTGPMGKTCKQRVRCMQAQQTIEKQPARECPVLQPCQRSACGTPRRAAREQPLSCSDRAHIRAREACSGHSRAGRECPVMQPCKRNKPSKNNQHANAQCCSHASAQPAARLAELHGNNHSHVRTGHTSERERRAPGIRVPVANAQ